MISTAKIPLLASAILLSLAPVSASAQGGPGMYGGPGMMGRYGGGPGEWGGGGWRMWGFGSERMLDRVDGRLAFLKAELKITDAQSAAWSKLAEAIKASAKSMTDRMKAVYSADEKAKTLPDRLDVQEQFVTARLVEIKQVNAAFKQLYSQLSDAQKKEADTLVLPMMGMGAGRGAGWSR